MVEQEYPLLYGEEMRPDEPCAQCSQRHGCDVGYGLPFVGVNRVTVGIHDFCVTSNRQKNIPKCALKYW